MKIETLKKLIEDAFQKSSDISEFKEDVIKLIDLYESDQTFIPTPGFIVDDSFKEVPYNEICPCNPKNGGSGICGCCIPNQLVKYNTILASDTTSVTSTFNNGHID